MGTEYVFEGSIEIEPPLNFAEIRKAQQACLGLMYQGYDKKNATRENVMDFTSLRLAIREDTRDTDEGMMTTVSSQRLIPAYSNGSLKYDMETVLSAIVKAVPGHIWTGEVVAFSEDNYAYKLSAERFAEDDPSTQQVKQVSGNLFIHWDDGSEATSVSSLT